MPPFEANNPVGHVRQVKVMRHKDQRGARLLVELE